MANKVELAVEVETPFTKHLKAILSGAKEKGVWITLSDFAGYMRLFQCYYDPILNVKFNEDDKFFHVGFTENKRYVAAIKSPKEDKKEDTCLPVHKY